MAPINSSSRTKLAGIDAVSGVIIFPLVTAAAPQGRLELLPYGNHMLNLVRAERFTPDLLRVLARAERPTSPGTTQDRLGP